MADARISEMTQQTAFEAANKIPLVDGTDNKYILASDLFEGSILICLNGTAYASTTVPQATVYIPFAITVTDVVAYATTAPTGSTLIVDVHENGTTIFTTQSNRPTISAGANTSTIAGSIEDTAIAANARVSFFVDQVGSTISGGDPLLITLKYKRA
jgi:hypothetical protein